MPEVPEPVIQLVRQQRNEPKVVRTLRSTVAATGAYSAALWLTNVKAPLLAPLTALLVVQVTLYATLTSGFRRVNAVVAGVTVAVGFSELFGLHWWSLGLLILAALTTGHLVRVNEFVPEVAISAMLVLGLTPQVAETAWDRVFETVIGAAVGLVFNFVFVPPVWVESAGEAIEGLARRMRLLLVQLGSGLDRPAVVEEAEDNLREARQLTDDVAEVDAELTQAEDSLRFNPRVREGVLSRVVLRTGLDTLEICTQAVRVLSRTMNDLAAQRTEEPVFPEEVAAAVGALFEHLARAVQNFAILITTQVSTSAEEAEARLVEEFEASRELRDLVAFMLLDRVQEHPRQWQLHGTLLATVDQMLTELDVERRTMRLAEELDRYSAKRSPVRNLPLLRRFPRRGRLASRVLGGAEQ